MAQNNPITFILIGTDDNNLAAEIHSKSDNLINYGRAIILRTAEKFITLMDNLSDDFEFRLLIHYGLKVDESAKNAGVGKQIAAALRDNYNIELRFFTRESPKFSGKESNSFIIYEEEKLYNYDDMNKKSFIDNLPVYCKKDILKTLKTEKTNVILQTPKIFIGCSVQGLPIARALRESLRHDATVHLWDDNGFFVPNTAVLDGLEKIVEEHDYGIFIFRPDDTIYNIESGGTKIEIARDNVIFEYGLFMGKHTRKKVWFLVPEPKGDFKLMTDLLGIIPLNYQVSFVDLAEKESDKQKKKQHYSDAISSAADSIKTDISTY